jgi:hypothetical protein
VPRVSSHWRSALGACSICFVLGCTTYSALELEPANGGASGGGTGGSAGNESGGTSAGAEEDGGRVGMAGGGAAPMAGSAQAGSASGSGGGGTAGGESAPLEPSQLTAAAATTDILREPDATGTAFADRCPDNQVVIGFHGTMDAPGGKSYLRSVQAVCGELIVSDSEPWQVTISEAMTLPMHDIEAAQPQMALCPPNQVMTGFAGRSGLWMDSVDVRCAPLNILGSAPNYLLVVGTPSTAGTIGGTTGGSPFDPLECAAGDVAVGQVGRTIYNGVVLGAFGVSCATLMLELDSG